MNSAGLVALLSHVRLMAPLQDERDVSRVRDPAEGQRDPWNLITNSSSGEVQISELNPERKNGTGTRGVKRILCAFRAPAQLFWSLKTTTSDSVVPEQVAGHVPLAIGQHGDVEGQQTHDADKKRHEEVPRRDDVTLPVRRLRQRLLGADKVVDAEVDEEDAEDGTDEEDEGFDQQEVLNALAEADEAVASLVRVLEGEDVEEGGGDEQQREQPYGDEDQGRDAGTEELPVLVLVVGVDDEPAVGDGGLTQERGCVDPHDDDADGAAGAPWRRVIPRQDRDVQRQKHGADPKVNQGLIEDENIGQAMQFSSQCDDDQNQQIRS